MWFKKGDWCCSHFKSCYENAGNRGPAFLVHRDHLGGPAFTLQFRAADKGEMGGTINTPYPLTLISDSRFFHCPYCGTNLAKFYRDRIDELYRPDLLQHES